jgi:GH24 family phage-related lysozyme (muramidase)
MQKKMTTRQPSPNALKLILNHEVGGGKKYYDKFLSSFTWPGGASGPTIAIGVDCGYYTPAELNDIFDFLSDDQILLICGASGKTGQAGKEYTRKLKEAKITVDWERAVEIFNELTWPKFSKLAERAFPGLDNLCDDAYGAIVSIVFNRGTSMKGDSRSEMRNVRDLINKKDYKKIAQEIRKMKRLWIGRGLDGLIQRREDEAVLVESCI